MPGVAPGFDILARIEVRAPFAVVVNALAVGEERTAQVIQGRPRS